MFLGIDLSCYTTSCAVADENGKIIYDGRKLLHVPQGKCGLRQSEMVFEHVKNLKDVFPAGFLDVKAIAVSVKPRPIEGSYRPVFAAAESYAEVISKAMGIPVYKLTHQHAHIGAALIGNKLEGQAIALHVSGGTTDVLKVSVRKGIVREIYPLGSASDISAGMFIDRIGVQLGCPFPAGKHMEELASETPAKIPSSVRGMSASFSGAQTAAEKLIHFNVSPEDIAAGTLRCVANTLEKLIRNAQKESGLDDVLLFGGVMCNKIIRQRLTKRVKANLIFADAKYSSDNACGLASQARLLFHREENFNA